MTARSVLVAGGGIAGTAAALALHKAGYEVTVVEAHPDTAEDIGAFLTLASNGMRALAELDATDAVTAVGFPLPVGGPEHRTSGALLPLLREDATPAAGIVEACAGPVMVTNATELPLGTPWHTGRVLLIGDAAHAASPATGQGASMALEDAVVLAKALRDSPDQRTAFARYEHHRRPRVEHNITVSGALSRGTRTTPPGRDDDPVTAQLAWNTPLPAAPDEHP